MTATTTHDTLLHPVPDTVRQRIDAELAAIEVAHGVTILYACETGSRGWGFASPDSDYDVRFIYVHPLDWYLRVTPTRDVIELPIVDELDINGWELRKALGLLGRGNATLQEWLSSPIVYRQDEAFVAELNAVAGALHRPERSFHHYLHMARGNHRSYLLGEQIRLKKYLYVLRPLLACLWVERGLGRVPMRFENLVGGVVGDAELRQAIDALLAFKRSAGEAEYGEPIPVLDSFLAGELERLAEQAPSAGAPPDYAPLDALLYRGVMAKEK